MVAGRHGVARRLPRACGGAVARRSRARKPPSCDCPLWHHGRWYLHGGSVLCGGRSSRPKLMRDSQAPGPCPLIYHTVVSSHSDRVTELGSFSLFLPNLPWPSLSRTKKRKLLTLATAPRLARRRASPAIPTIPPPPPHARPHCLCYPLICCRQPGRRPNR